MRRRAHSDFRNHHGRTIGHIDLRRSGIGVTILRADFHRLLVEKPRGRACRSRSSKRLDSIEDRGAEVVAHFEDGSTASGDVLIAADGVNSRVRALILPEQAQARYTGMLGVGGFAAGGAAPADARDADQLNFVVGPRLQFGVREPVGGFTALGAGGVICRRTRSCRDGSCSRSRTTRCARASSPRSAAGIRRSRR